MKSSPRRLLVFLSETMTMERTVAETPAAPAASASPAAAASSLAYNAELVKQLSPTMKAVIHNLTL